ncbi:MAG: single-stranded DNA-binding protein [Alphaproteobacteria bacterium]|nr:single-stranded DNA-binding protein [Alphaproteobacteria bacterium]
MAGSVNKVILVGNLGKDPEIRTFQNGGRKASFSIATSEGWKDKASGEWRDKTEWHNISVMNENLVKLCERYLKKGSKVYIEGKLETRKWQDKDGNDRYTTEIVLGPFRGELTMLDSKNSGGGSFGGGSDAPVMDQGGFGGGSIGGGSSAPDLDDDIPF